MDGWFKYYRSLLAHPIRMKSLEQAAVIDTILGNVNHKPNKWHWKGEEYEVTAGQWITSVKTIIEKSPTGLTRQNVRTVLKNLEKAKFLTIESTNDGIKITVLNWGLYQGGDDEPNQPPNQRNPMGEHPNHLEIDTFQNHSKSNHRTNQPANQQANQQGEASEALNEKACVGFGNLNQPTDQPADQPSDQPAPNQHLTTNKNDKNNKNYFLYLHDLWRKRSKKPFMSPSEKNVLELIVEKYNDRREWVEEATKRVPNHKNSPNYLKGILDNFEAIGGDAPWLADVKSEKAASVKKGRSDPRDLLKMMAEESEGGGKNDEGRGAEVIDIG